MTIFMAFSDESRPGLGNSGMDTGSRQENASKQESKARF
jgi:hypothetical protein